MSPRWDEDGPTPVRSPYAIGATSSAPVWRVTADALEVQAAAYRGADAAATA